MTATATMIQILERREQRLRLELTVLAREIALKRDNLAALDATIAAVNRRIDENASARFASKGPGSLSTGEQARDKSRLLPGVSKGPGPLSTREQCSRSVAELLQLEQNSQSLSKAAMELVTLKGRGEQDLASLVERQRILSQRWHREEIRREYVTRLARRERVRAETRQFDADDESFVERSGNGAVKLPRLAVCR
jgi:hypothetical protein